jgi:short-subunit dehydrogenase
LRLELRGSGVHVLEVIPGPIDTAVQGESRLIPGAERVLGRAPLGDPAKLAHLAVRALERERNRLVYPRRLAPLYAFPPLYRRYILSQAGRLAREIDTDDRRVVRTGSMGDQVARDARAAWESRRGA